MTTLAQLHTDQLRRFDRKAFTYRHLLKKGKGWLHRDGSLKIRVDPRVVDGRPSMR